MMHKSEPQGFHHHGHDVFVGESVQVNTTSLGKVTWAVLHEAHYPRRPCTLLASSGVKQNSPKCSCVHQNSSCGGC